MTRDPDILLRILLGAIAQREHHKRVAQLVKELRHAIQDAEAAPKRETLLTACRELLGNPPPD